MEEYKIVQKVGVLIADNATNNESAISDLTFRYHPVMTRTSGFQSWPPIWTTTRRERNDRPVGEIGILKQVLMNDLFNSMLFLIIEYQSVRYMGAMQFDDSKFCYEISNILKSHVGYSIKEIGDLVLSPARPHSEIALV